MCTPALGIAVLTWSVAKHGLAGGMQMCMSTSCASAVGDIAQVTLHLCYMSTATDSICECCVLQGVFALIAPGQVVPNLVAGAIAEAGAQQAGDMMQDFKTAHLLGVRPRAQFYAMLIGSFASVFVSVGAYALYTSAFQIPGPEFPAPTAEIWLDMAELVSRCH